MNLYEFEGKQFFEKHGIKIPKGLEVLSGMDAKKVYEDLGVKDVVVKVQILSGKRGKNNGIVFCSSAEEVEKAVSELFSKKIKEQYVAAVRIEEKLDIAEEHYLSITYDTNAKEPVLIYSKEGGMDIEEVPAEKIKKMVFKISDEKIPVILSDSDPMLAIRIPHCKRRKGSQSIVRDSSATPQNDLNLVAEKLWQCFKKEDARLVEINPLVKTTSGEWIAADAKVAIDDDAFFRHEEWKELEPRTMMGRPPTDREIMVKKIDAGEGYYRGTAGKYIELDGDIGLVLNGGGASIANMDALEKVGLKAANYTEYSGNPPREKVYELTKIIMSKPGLKGLWACGVVSNFTNVEETFKGFADALEEIKPTYPIVVRRDGPGGEAGRQILLDCAERNGLNMKVFGKDVPMTETAQVLADMINES